MGSSASCEGLSQPSVTDVLRCRSLTPMVLVFFSQFYFDRLKADIWDRSLNRISNCFSNFGGQDPKDATFNLGIASEFLNSLETLLHHIDSRPPLPDTVYQSSPNQDFLTRRSTFLHECLDKSERFHWNLQRFVILRFRTEQAFCHRASHFSRMS